MNESDKDNRNSIIHLILSMSFAIGLLTTFWIFLDPNQCNNKVCFTNFWIMRIMVIVIPIGGLVSSLYLLGVFEDVKKHFKNRGKI